MHAVLKRALNWFDAHALLILASIAVAFIPLYPKLPLFEAIPGYIVRVRLEDILIVLVSFVWFIQAIRGKIAWKNSALGWIATYALGGLLTLISAVLIIQTIPAQLLHIGKSTLHYFRYLEYFSLVAIVFSAIKTKKHLYFLLGVMLTALVGVTIYGYGQRYYYWPVYSTMNREFSKGIRLYLTEHARVQSTFGGHYDLSAYLVILLPITLALALSTTNKWLRIALHATHIGGLWLMVVAASRISFFGYLIAVELVVILFALAQTQWLAKLRYFVIHSAALGLLVGWMMFFYGESIYDRFLQVLDGYPEYRQLYHDGNKKRKELVGNALVFIGLKEPSPPSDGMSLAELEARNRVLANSDERPTSNKPSDVYTDVPDQVQVATMSADGTMGFVTVERERTYSDNALKYGLSLAIRLDTLWPRAIAGFQTNPILGSGYATLTKESVEQFTEAESTDNNFLRTLGETGLLGFLTFYGLIVFVMRKAFLQLGSKDMLLRSLSVGILAASVGLLINATYIDVFAASKVAFTYWAVVGLYLAAEQLLMTSKRTSSNLTNQTHSSQHAKKLRRG
jgi:hypothetical protein